MLSYLARSLIATVNLAYFLENVYINFRRPMRITSYIAKLSFSCAQDHSAVFFAYRIDRARVLRIAGAKQKGKHQCCVRTE